MAPNDQGHQNNPLKSHGENKGRTQELSDKARPSGARPDTSETVTGQGGATKKDRSPTPGHAPDESRYEREGEPAPSHPSRGGGVRADEPGADPRTEHDRPGVKRKGPSPADEPNSERTGTAPQPETEGQRTGKTGEDRHRPK